MAKDAEFDTYAGPLARLGSGLSSRADTQSVCSSAQLLRAPTRVSAFSSNSTTFTLGPALPSSAALSVAAGEQLPARFDRRYQLYTWGLFGLALALVLGVEAGFTVWTIRVSSYTGLLHHLYLAAQPLRQSLATLRAGQLSPAQLGVLARQALADLRHFHEVLRWANERGLAAWRVQMACTALHVLVLAAVGLCAMRWRTHPAVKSRGYGFMVHAFVAGLLYVASFACLASLHFLRFTPAQLDPTNMVAALREDRLLKLRTFAILTVGIVCAAQFVGALVQRQRVISLLFSGSVFTLRRNSYWAPFPLHFVVAAASVSGFVVWYFAYGWQQGMLYLGLLPLWLLPLVYGAWFLVYILRSRHAHLAFSDYYGTLRVWALFVLYAVVLIAFNLADGTTLFNFGLGWLQMARVTVTMAALDGLLCQLVQVRLHIATTNTQPAAPRPPDSSKQASASTLVILAAAEC